MPIRWITQKRKYRQYQARTGRLPADYRAAIAALERYLLMVGPGRSDGVLAMLEDLADLFEQSAASRTPLREVVGADPVEFAEAFVRNYPEGGWLTRERDRLADAVERAVGGVPGGEKRAG